MDLKRFKKNKVCKKELNKNAKKIQALKQQSKHA